MHQEFLELKEFYKIGSQVAGIVKDVLVKENSIVKKGQLFAEIEISKGDTDLRAAKYAVEKAQQEYDFKKNFMSDKRHFINQGNWQKTHFNELKPIILKPNQS